MNDNHKWYQRCQGELDENRVETIVTKKRENELWTKLITSRQKKYKIVTTWAWTVL